MKKTFILLVTLLLGILCYGQWTQISPLPTGNPLFDVSFISNDTGWVVGKKIISKTIDGGETWDSKAIDSIDIYDLSMVSQTKGWASGWNPDSGLGVTFKYDGIDWIKITDSTVNINGTIRFVSPLVGFEHCNGLFKTIDGGVNWSQMIINNESSILQMQFINEQIGWVSAGTISTQNRFYKTIDQGNTWVPYLFGEGILQGFSFADANRGWAIGKVNNGSFDGPCFIKRFNGITWIEEFQSTCLINTIKAINATNVWAVGDSGYVYKYNGNSWISQRIDTDKSLNKVFFTDENNGWIVGYDGLIFKTNDGGASWVNVKKCLFSCNIGIGSICSTDNNHVWVAGNKMIGKYDGSSWTYQDVPDLMTNISFVNNNIGFVLDWRSERFSPCHLWKTIDSGNSWDEIYDFSIYPQIICFTNENNGWCTSGSNGLILKSIDGGQTWVDKSIPTLSNILDMGFVDDTFGWIIKGNYDYPYETQLLSTIDGGDSWIPITPEFGQHFVGIKLFDRLNGMVFGETGSIYKTSSGGLYWNKTPYDDVHLRPPIKITCDSTIWALKQWSGNSIYNYSNQEWTEQYIPIESTIGDFAFTNNNGWAIGGSTVLFTDNGGLINSTDNNVALARSENLSNYPNPTVDHTTIRYLLKENEIVELSLFDHWGHLVKVMIREKQDKGIHEFFLNTIDLSEGMYFYKLYAGNTMMTKKLIIYRSGN